MPFVEEAMRWLPRSSKGDAAAAARGESSSSVVGRAPRATSAERSRVLVVDDNSDMREYVAQLLAASYDVDTATDGMEALERIGSVMPDLVITDVMMPRLDGLALVRALRSDEETRALPVVLLSARAGEEDTIEGMESGADDYLVKPFGARELLARVKTHVELSRMRRESLREIEELYGQVRAANQSKSEFLAAMSHELRTPLNAVIGYVDLLLLGVRGQLTGAQTADLERVRGAGQYLLSLINDLLNFTRLEAGRVEFRLQNVTLNGVIASALELVQEQLTRKGLRLHFQPAATDVTAYADAERVQQMLINLLTNAIKYTDSGGTISISVDEHTTASGAAVARVHVRDTGMGIPPEQLTRIFEPFVQVQRHPGAGSQQGVGLGLSITRDLAHGMGGDVQVVSEVGRGSTFTIVLPR